MPSFNNFSEISADLYLNWLNWTRFHRKSTVFGLDRINFKCVPYASIPNSSTFVGDSFSDFFNQFFSFFFFWFLFLVSFQRNSSYYWPRRHIKGKEWKKERKKEKKRKKCPPFVNVGQNKENSNIMSQLLKWFFLSI